MKEVSSPLFRMVTDIFHEFDLPQAQIKQIVDTLHEEDCHNEKAYFSFTEVDLDATLKEAKPDLGRLIKSQLK